LSFDSTVEMTVNWYKTFYQGEVDTETLTLKQILLFSDLAKGAGLEWAQ
jgi:hypothetical protein